MAKLDDLIPLVHARIADAPKVLIRNALIRTCREFFRVTRFWVDTFEGKLRVGHNYAPIDSAAGTEFIQMLNLSVNGVEVMPLSSVPINVAGQHPNSAAIGYSEGDPGLFFNGAATVEIDYSVRLALMPSLTGEKIDEAALSLWGEFIADGACAELMTQPGKSWTDPAMAQYLNQAFHSAIRKAKNSGANSYTVERQTVSQRRWV